MRHIQTSLKHISCLTAIFIGCFSGAVELPTLQPDARTVKGKLDCGIEYFVRENALGSGVADFALVRKTYSDKSSARIPLKSTAHFSDRPPYKFFSSVGVGYSRQGYLIPRDGSVSFLFRDVPTTRRSVCDSTLLFLLDAASESTEPQAVIVAGDIAGKEIVEKLTMLSLLVQRREIAEFENYYVWEPRPERTVYYHTGDYGEIAGVNLSYRTPRAAEKMMPTAQPVVFRTYSEELGKVITSRIIRRFSSEGIPLASIRFRHRSSAQEPGDEVFGISVWTSKSRLPEAVSLISSTLSSIDKLGVGKEEYSDIRRECISEKRMEAGGGVSNTELVNKCTSVFLYNDNLSDKATEFNAIVKSSLSEDRMLSLFNKFSSALLDSAANLSVQFDVAEDAAGQQTLMEAFDKGWSSPESVSYSEPVDPGLEIMPETKIRISKNQSEPISRGRLWTFSNGMKVVYKKTDDAGRFNYALILRGGMSEVEEKCPGEAAFTSDMLMLSHIRGLDPSSFRKLLQKRGVSLEGKVSVGNMVLSGTARSSDLPFVLGTLLSVAEHREKGTEEFDYYRTCSNLNIQFSSRTLGNVNSVMDSLSRPDYRYSGKKESGTLGDDFPVRAEKYFSGNFSNAADGVLVISGDLDEKETKALLCSYLSGFRTSRNVAVRKSVPYNLSSGAITVSAKASDGIFGRIEPYANLAFSASVPCTMDNFLNLKVARYAVRKALIQRLAEYGASVEVSVSTEAFPTERMSLYVNCHPCAAFGLPAGVSPVSSYDILPVLRETASSLGNLDISEEDLSLWKKAVRTEMEGMLSSGNGLVDFVIFRYSEGKDLVSGYSSHLDSVSEDSVRKILKAISSGSKVEYILK